MIKFDKITLEPEFIDPSVCFCFGGGATNGGSGKSFIGGKRDDAPIGFRGEQSADPMKGMSPAERQGISQERFDALSSIRENVQEAVDTPRQARSLGQDMFSNVPSLGQNQPVATQPSLMRPASSVFMEDPQPAPPTSFSADQQKTKDLTIGELGRQFGFSPSINLGGFSIGFPENVSVKNPGLSLNYRRGFAMGGAVDQGIASLFSRGKM